MAIQKPEPLVIGGKAFYTLTKYDPVDVTVTVPMVCDDDIDLSIDQMLFGLEHTSEDLRDDAWIAKNLDGTGISSRADLEAMVRADLEKSAQAASMQAEYDQVVKALASRLCQSVPDNIVTAYADEMAAQLEAEMAAQGVKLDDILGHAGLTRADLAAEMSGEARERAEAEAAMDAYASEKHVTVDDDRLAAMLAQRYGVPEEDGHKMIAEADAKGFLAALRNDAVRETALDMAHDEANIVRVDETPEQAKERVANIRQQLRLGAELQDDDERPEFKLV